MLHDFKFQNADRTPALSLRLIRHYLTSYLLYLIYSKNWFILKFEFKPVHKQSELHVGEQRRLSLTRAFAVPTEYMELGEASDKVSTMSRLYLVSAHVRLKNAQTTGR